MSTVNTRTIWTPDDLARLPDERDFELIDGRLVERNMGALAVWIENVLANLLTTYCQQHDLGWVFSSGMGFYCFPDRPNTVRRPDVSFVSRERLDPKTLGRGYIQLVPDLVVEVISPTDNVYELDEKIADFLQAGAKLAWVIHPEQRFVRVYHPNRREIHLLEDDELNGEAVIPGFLCRVSSLFP